MNQLRITLRPSLGTPKLANFSKHVQLASALDKRVTKNACRAPTKCLEDWGKDNKKKINETRKNEIVRIA
jgi:hypothetical protein